MRCCVPFCRSTADNAAGAAAITFHYFPLDPTLQMKWRRALGKHDQPFKESAVVCSQHFLDDEFYYIEGGQRQVCAGVIPSAVKLCMICLDTDRNLVSLSKYNLEEAYEKVTGHSICREGNLKQTLCKECAQQLINFDRFRSKSLRARAAMMDLVIMHETVTIRHIKKLNHIRELLKSDIVKIDFASDHCDLHIQQNNYEDVQTDPVNIMPDANVVVKSEDFECVTDGSGIYLNSKETKDENEVVNIENQDSSECMNNILDASILLDTKLMNETLRNELGLVKSIKSECSVSFDDAGHGDDMFHGEYGSDECNTQLAQGTPTALHSQQRESNQGLGGDSSADYPYISVNVLPTGQYEVVLEKKNSIDCEKEIFQTPDSVNETEFKFVEKVTHKPELIKQNFLQEYFCEHCEYKCSKRNNIVKHLENHAVEQRLSCSSRDHTFKDKVSLASHMKVYSREKHFSCQLCEYSCRKKGYLVRHMRIHTDEKPFSCKLCKYAGKEKENLVRHMRVHTGDKLFSCKLCKYKGTYKGSLKRHMRVHTGEKPFACKFCEYACGANGDLVKHMRIHTGEKPFLCNICQYACKEKGRLTKHMRIHTGEKPFSCKLCEFKSTYKGSLVNHMAVHTGEKPFNCKFCEYKTTYKGSLVIHLRKHSGEKPFSCNLCEYACGDKGRLVKHMKTHTREKPFSCNLCEYKSLYKGSLVSHMSVHINDNPFL